MSESEQLQDIMQRLIELLDSASTRCSVKENDSRSALRRLWLPKERDMKHRLLLQKHTMEHERLVLKQRYELAAFEDDWRFSLEWAAATAPNDCGETKK